MIGLNLVFITNMTKQQRYVLNSMKNGYTLAELKLSDIIKLYNGNHSEKINKKIVAALLEKHLIIKVLHDGSYNTFELI